MKSGAGEWEEGTDRRGSKRGEVTALEREGAGESSGEWEAGLPWN